MDQSTHYNLNLVTGSDKVNPLTVDRPNYETIDEQMYKNQTAAISEATELKSSTVHAITCLTEGAVFFRFTATSDFAAGDTFTYNGTPVSAVLPTGSGLQDGAFKINSTVLCSIIGTLLTVYTDSASGVASDSEKLGGQLPAYYAKATDAISTYVHSRIGTVNNFVGTGANGRVKIVADIQAGDTIQINGQTVTAFAGADDFVSTVAGQDLVGKTLFFLLDSTSDIVNFKMGGGGRVTVEGLTADVLAVGKSVKIMQGSKEILATTGTLEVLAAGSVRSSVAQICTYTSSGWNFDTRPGTITVNGNIKAVFVYMEYATTGTLELFGIQVPSSLREMQVFTDGFTSNTFKYAIGDKFTFVALGSKN